MELHMLLTPEIKQSKPESIVITNEWGDLLVVFDNEDGSTFTKIGLHCFVEGQKEDIINWLKPFDSVYIGSGSPMMESFRIMHVDENL